ncbi:MAG: ECF transporter S component [Micrococcales bacterium]
MIRRRLGLGTVGLWLIATLSLSAFCWPLLLNAGGESAFAQTMLMVLMPSLVIFALIEFGSGSIDTKQLATLAVITAVNSLVRLLGAGVGGIETVFFLIVIAGFVFRAGFGYLIGSLSLLVSALVGAGVGPWLPFQMMAAGLIGLGAGLLPRSTHRWIQVATLVTYSIIAAYVYGALMTLWNWPFLAGATSTLSYVPGAGIPENLRVFVQYELLTGGLLWDTGRAVTTAVLVLLTAPTLLPTLDRAANRVGVRN